MNAALMRLQLAQHWRGRRWIIALAIIVALMVLGLMFSKDKHDPLGFGVLAGAIVALNFGIAQDRKQAFDRFLTNFFEPQVVWTHKITAMLVSYCAFFVAVFGLVSLFWLDVPAAAWYSAYWFVVLGLLLPIVLLVESAADTTNPAPFAMLIAIAVQIVAAQIWGMETWLRMLDLEPRLGSLGQLSRLGLVAAGWNALLLPIAAAVYLLRHEQGHSRRKGPARSA
jgi:hypothetical protein